MIRNIVRFVVILGLVCSLMGGGVALMYARFKETLASRDAAAAQAAILAVCPAGASVDAAAPLAGEPLAPDAVYEAKDAAGRVVAWVAGGAEPGYSGLVRVMVGAVKADSGLAIHNVTVVSQSETPGLGANVALSRSSYTLWQKLFGSAEPEVVSNPFLGRFKGKTADTVQDVQAMTAATITSDAAKAAIDQALGRIRLAQKETP